MRNGGIYSGKRILLDLLISICYMKSIRLLTVEVRLFLPSLKLRLLTESLLLILSLFGKDVNTLIFLPLDKVVNA